MELEELLLLQTRESLFLSVYMKHGQKSNSPSRLSALEAQQIRAVSPCWCLCHRRINPRIQKTKAFIRPTEIKSDMRAAPSDVLHPSLVNFHRSKLLTLVFISARCFLWRPRPLRSSFNQLGGRRTAKGVPIRKKGAWL